MEKSGQGSKPHNNSLSVQVIAAKAETPIANLDKS